MKRIYKILIAVVAVAFAASFALAHGRHHGHAWFQAHVTHEVDEALDAAKATPAQRNALHASLDHVFAVAHEGRQAHAAEIEEALQLFQADHIDPAAVAAHREKKEAEAKQLGDAVVQFIYDAHSTLTAPQRQAVVAFARAEKLEHGKGGSVQHKVMGAMMQARIDDALDQIKATPAQRTTVHAAADRVLAAFKEAHADRGGDLEQLLEVFAADQIDGTKLNQLRAEHLARMHTVGDAIVQAISDVHDALSADQRTALVAFIKAHHPHPQEHQG
jgi:Spy/CpxP family protein refolding chaperone